MRTELDLELLGQTVQDLYRFKQGEVMSAIIHLGVRLGLFDTLAENDGATSDDLAAATGLHERWVREWLHAVAAADLAEHDDGRFNLPIIRPASPACSARRSPIARSTAPPRPSEPASG